MGLSARLVLAIVFIAAAWPKLLDPQGFAESISNYPLAPQASIAIAARLLPSAEAVLALALFLGFYLRGAALLCLMLLALFQVAMAQAVFRGIDLSCGCFGNEPASTISWLNFLRNFTLMACAILVLKYPNSAWRRLTELRRRPKLQT
ncbi:MAG: DoxX family membrane protein [Myxococcales bacterium]|nr:MAG: DoxX family membrane protein [Myxococcales bacterium]